VKQTDRFRAVRQRGAWATGAALSVGILPNALPHPRIGIRTQRGYGGAVARNLAKRWVREAYRREKAQFVRGHDAIIVLKRTEKLSFALVQEDLHRVCQKLSRRVASASA
jgi:ribonuclease P protein component